MRAISKLDVKYKIVSPNSETKERVFLCGEIQKFSEGHIVTT